jgi:quercetin dioxygenase-like cupin family protein
MACAHVDLTHAITGHTDRLAIERETNGSIINRKGAHMPSEAPSSRIFERLADHSFAPKLDLFGPTIEFLTWSNEFCVMRGMIPPGAVVPLHRHPDAEDFFIVSGTQQVLVDTPGGLEWRDAHAGDYVRIPGHVPHARRNVSAEPAVDLIVTTARLGRFLQKVGRPVTDSFVPPTLAQLMHFLDAAADYGYLMSSPEANAAIGITLPSLSS